MITFRPGHPDDLKAVFNLLVTMHAEIGMAPLNPEKALGIIDGVLRHGAPIVAEKDGRIVGSTGIAFQQWWYSDHIFAGDYWNYVHPEHRHSSIAARLLEAAKERAMRHGVPLVMSVLTENEPERKNALYRRHLTPAGGNFVMR